MPEVGWGGIKCPLMVVSNENQILFPMHSVLSIIRANGGGGDAQITEKHEHSELYILLCFTNTDNLFYDGSYCIFVYTVLSDNL
jgi:hypothetical protein